MEDGIAAEQLDRFICVDMQRPTVGIRNRHMDEKRIIDLDKDVGEQLNHFVEEIGRVPAIAS